jgi:hypothetical protein
MKYLESEFPGEIRAELRAEATAEERAEPAYIWVQRALRLRPQPLHQQTSPVRTQSTPTDCPHQVQGSRPYQQGKRYILLFRTGTCS